MFAFQTLDYQKEKKKFFSFFDWSHCCPLENCIFYGKSFKKNSQSMKELWKCYSIFAAAHIMKLNNFLYIPRLVLLFAQNSGILSFISNNFSVLIPDKDFRLLSTPIPSCWIGTKNVGRNNYPPPPSCNVFISFPFSLKQFLTNPIHKWKFFLSNWHNNLFLFL